MESDSEEEEASEEGKASGDSEARTAVSLEPNVWDCALMIGLYGLRAGQEMFGKFNVVLTFVLLAANVMVQSLFVIAVKSMVQENPYESEVLLDRRLQEGHLYNNLDHKTMQTKAQQTCSLQAFDRLEDTAESMQHYLRLDGRDLVLSGSAICLLAMLTWTISIFSEVRRVFGDLLHVVISLPRSSKVVTETRGGIIIVNSVPLHNKLHCVLVNVPRVAVALLLLGYGLQFLANTVDIRELLTNAVALEFVKTIDELLFEAIAPRKLMRFVRQVKVRVFPGFLPHESTHAKVGMHGYRRSSTLASRSGVPVQSCYVLARLLFISLAVCAGYYVYLRPMVGFTRNVYDDLCGHNTNFTYMIHPITRLPIFATVNPFDRFNKESGLDMGSLRCFYAAQYEMLRMRAGFLPQYSRGVNETLVSLVNGTNRRCWAPAFVRSQAACPEQSMAYMNHMVANSRSFYHDELNCRDQDVALAVLKETCTHEHFQRDTPQELSFFKGVTRCADFGRHCRNSTAHNISLAWFWRIQQVCPETCGQCKWQRLGPEPAAAGGAPAPKAGWLR